MNIGIINYGISNINSVIGAIKNLGFEHLIIESINDFDRVNKLILPGIGNFKKCKEILDYKSYTSKIRQKVLIEKTPILGICLGMQLLANFGSEGSQNCLAEGLNLIEGKVINLKELGSNLVLPHIGWNNVIINKKSQILHNVPNNTDFYFVHSYAYSSINKNYIIAEANHGINFPAIINHNHIWGTQFHPEKSSKAGLEIIKNFITN
ncbi:MAG: imidazole glycerol phosphate synthase subunit HisH [Candidatus Endolissoclinum sp. TMED37]|nr:MAG: imidazole glycerol phosphate synthase subunit HisH [Candidatus Endolissoclinum sp. TMED37]|tara:strand:+ start:1731 stop:2354 length:624 start_codon:yes stop_codon:yes gene_type:complete